VTTTLKARGSPDRKQTQGLFAGTGYRNEPASKSIMIRYEQIAAKINVDAEVLLSLG
jgi:hypothetical protein